MTDYITQYQNYLLNTKKSSANTVDSYLRDVRGYLDYCDKYAFDPEKANEETVKSYLSYLTKLGKTQSTVSRSLASIRSFYRYLIFDGRVDENPTNNIHPEKTQRKLPQILTEKEVDLLLSQPDITTLRGCRDKAMLEVMYATGVRVSELIAMNVDDVNLSVSIIHCRTDKTDRALPMYKEAIKALEDYLTRVRPVIINDRRQKALFMNLNGERLTRQGFWKIIKGYAESAGINKDITPHTIRHSFATHLLENGAGVRDIQELLGQSGMSSANMYTQIINQQYKRSYNRFHPKAGASK